MVKQRPPFWQGQRRFGSHWQYFPHGGPSFQGGFSSAGPAGLTLQDLAMETFFRALDIRKQAMQALIPPP